MFNHGEVNEVGPGLGLDELLRCQADPTGVCNDGEVERGATLRRQL